MPQSWDKKLKKWRPARGTTKREFIDFCKTAVAVINAKLADETCRKAWEEAGLKGVKPTISFDNPNIHGGEKNWGNIMAACGMTKRQRFPLTKYSPDIHRIIEHTHARLVRDFQEWLDTHDGDFDLPAYKVKLIQLFYEKQTAKVIAADVSTLRELYSEIIKAGGGWPPKRFR